MSDLEKLARQGLEVVAEAAQFIRRERVSWSLDELNYKEDTSLVTRIDVGSEERLVEGFRRLLPEAEFLAEEKHRDTVRSDLYWIIDPVDGTTNMVHQVPVYCISAALCEGDKIILGILHEINTNEVFLAHKGKEGATLNGCPIRVSQTSKLQRSLLATGFPTGDFSRLDEYMEALKSLMQRSRGIRRLGSAAMDLAYVACGRFDGFFEYGLNAWDVAAGAYIVQKAGGNVTDFSGNDNYLFGREILASNLHIHQELQTFFK